jgi:hypothetical protein
VASDKRDFRVAITPETDVALRAMARAFDRDRQSVAREVLHEWAMRKLHEYRVGTGLAYSDGLFTASDGTPTARDGSPTASRGDLTASNGTRRNGRRED